MSINNDTIYSIAQVDVSGGPVLLRVPDTAGRYYVLQFVDAWTNNFAYVGRRATGTAAGSFLLVPPGWKSDAPGGVPVIEFPTDLGTINDPAWQIGDRNACYLARALAARGGLWGNKGYEAAYPVTYTDADGDQLDGHHRYVLRLDEDPPVDAFWSLTMYDLPDFYLVANPIDRYSIGDRTPGLRRDQDGSLTIVIQHEQPADTSNWLPAPAAPFRPLMRLYQPRAAVLNGSYKIPPITKAS